MSESDIQRKEQRLLAILSELGSAVVAFSGGADSTYLAWAARRALGERSLAVTATGVSLPRSEMQEAINLAAHIGIRHSLIETGEMDNPAFQQNAPDRCYHCKKELFTSLAEMAKRHGLTWVVAGENTDDEGDYRPGRKAAQELNVRYPLREAGLSKAEVRELSAAAGLPTAGKPAMACLASRIPYGTPLTPELLARIEQGEEFLRACGLRQFRLRHHGDLCRLETGKDELDKVMQPPLRDQVVNFLKTLGYRYVTLDLQGYRTGSMNEVLPDRISEPLSKGRHI